MVQYPQPDGRSRTTPRPLADSNRQDDHKEKTSGPSLFGSPGGSVAIHDGQFNATAGHHISVTINARDQATPSPRPKPRRRKRTRNNDVLTGQANTALTDCEASRTSFETYYLNLSTKGRGSPLWIPGPNQRLSIEYRRSGVRSGDVGIITSQGSFDFLFNIFLPRDHPINSKGVPEGFVPIDPEELDLREHSAFSKDSFLASNSIIRNNCNRNSSELCFEASASEGAVLAMPEGSVSQDVGNIARLQKYAKQHAESWYKHIICQRGRTLKNGSVRLVTGYDNASAWGMAAFANSFEQGGPQDLRFAASGSSKAGDLYFWDYSGVAETKAGPGEREVEALRNMVPDPEGTQYQNQSLFIRTLNITFQDRVWQQLKIGCDYEDSDEDENGSSDSGSFSSRDSSFSGVFNPPSSSSRSQPNEKKGANSSAGKSLNRAFAMDAHIDTSGAGGALNLHPSSIMNDYILRRTPSAKMAITSDEDWMCLIKETDNILPPADEICDRIRQAFEIRDHEGILTLAKTLSSVQPSPSQMSFDPSSIAGSSKLHDTLQSRPYKPYPDSYEMPLIRPSIPPNFQSLGLYGEESPFNPYPHWMVDSETSVSTSIPTSLYPHKIYDNHRQYGTIGILADYNYPHPSLHMQISSPTATGNEYVAQPASPSNPYLRHLRPLPPVPLRYASEASRVDDFIHELSVRTTCEYESPWLTISAHSLLGTQEAHRPRKRGKTPKEITDFLEAWLHRHSDHPYPSEEEKNQLCHATGLSMSQLSNWMINARRRILAPAHSAASGPTTTTAPFPPSRRASLPSADTLQLYRPMTLQSMPNSPNVHHQRHHSETFAHNLRTEEDHRLELPLRLDIQEIGNIEDYPSLLPPRHFTKRAGPYPTEIRIDHQSDETVSSSPLISGAQTTLSSAMDDRFITNREHIDDPHSHGEVSRENIQCLRRNATSRSHRQLQ
ncbi:hypothetical protein CPC08DRAFT_712973 [Agrocybe pediades]|nr:hypothetical protein CPC08DRAFT_712973 [Agrocybe pediades]